MADDSIRDAVMKAFPLAPVRKPARESLSQADGMSDGYEDSTKIEYDKPNVEIPEKLLTKKSGMDLLGEALQHRIELEEEPEDIGLDDCRRKANEMIDRNLIRDLLT